MPVYYARMHPIQHIRENVFQATQMEFSKIAGVAQATISRWENGEFEPGRAELERIRAEAMARHLAWDDRWFFELPSEQVRAS